MKRKQHRGESARGHCIPASLQGVLDSFAGCFTGPSFQNFAAVVAGWLLCQGRHCISRVIQVAGGAGSAKHFSTLYRFLSRARWSGDDLGRVLFGLLLRCCSEELEAIVDDTLCRHRGPRIFGVAMHHDALRSTYGRRTSVGSVCSFACGHCWVVLSLRIPLPWDRARGIAVPILFRLYRSKRRCDERAYRKRTELAAELVALLEAWLPPGHRLSVVGDGEYASRTLVRALASETVFIGPVVRDAALFEPPGRYRGVGRPRKVGQRLPSPERLASQRSQPWRAVYVHAYGKRRKLLIKEVTCLWYTVAGSRLVRVVVTRDPRGRAEERAYFSTDPQMDAVEILERFARRWLIEVSFRDVKQHLGLEHPQNGWSRGKSQRRGAKRPGPQPRGRRGHAAVSRTVPLAFVSYAIVVLWYLDHGAAPSDVRRVLQRAPWYRAKDTPSFLDMLVALRRETWAERLSGHPGNHRGGRKLHALLPDALLAA